MAQGTRALIVDDDPSIRAVLSLAMKKDGWQVDTVDCAEAGLGMLGQAFEVFLVDKNMPGMSGVDFIKVLRDKNQQSAVLMMTAAATVDSAVATLNLGIDGYLEKPFDDIYDAVAKINVAVERRRLRLQRESSATADYFKRAMAHLGSDATPTLLDVLIVSPEAADHSWIGERLGREGHRFTVASSSSEALAYAAKHGPDLIIADFALADPGLPELVAKIRQGAGHTSFVVVYRTLSVRLVGQLIELGVRSLLQRPLDDRTFAEAIDAVVRKRIANAKN